MGERGEDVPSIELRHVSKRFGAVTAVADVSLRVEAGEFLTLLGPSGCGKTTTLRMIGGFERPSSGSLLIHGEEMDERPPYRRPVNTVFQNYALFPHLTVGQNVAYGLAMARVPTAERTARVAQALELVRLPHVEGRRPAELSGGQQQRVALARALVNRPRVLLLDEPLGALDLKLRRAMQLELRRVHREVGATFVYVTHDQEEALTMSDRIAVMYEGRILQVGSPGDIYERPRTRFVADFVGQMNLLEGRLVGFSGETATVEVPGSGRIAGTVVGSLASGAAVTVAVRPERIAFAGERAGSTMGEPNRLVGNVVETTYLGTHSQFAVRLGSAQTITVHRQNVGDAAAPRIGEAVEMAFAVASTMILPSE